MASDGRIPWRQISGIPEDLGQPPTVLVPFTATTTAGEPTLLWDDDDNLMMVEEPR